MIALAVLAALALADAATVPALPTIGGTRGDSCDCVELRSCLLSAWEPCFAQDVREPPELFWILQKPREVWRSPCRRLWRQVEDLDPAYAHINYALQCQQEDNVCYAAVNTTSLSFEDIPRDELKPCWESALACQFIHATGCDHYDQDAMWRKCWKSNTQFQKFGKKFLQILEDSWKCETLESIQKSDDELSRYF